MAEILRGTPVRDTILAALRPRIARLSRPPGLAVVLVGNNPASEIYVRHKVKACEEMGIHSEKLTPPALITTSELLSIVRELNGRAEIDGILVQMPLPPQVDSRAVLVAIAPEKDVDGFHPCNVGNMVAGRPGPLPCTPAGIIRLLEHYKVQLSGKRAVVVGRSDIVGKPMSILLLRENATVTICHSRTKELPKVCREGEILVAAVGHPGTITADHIRPGAVVVDVGTNHVTDRALVERLFSGSPERLAVFDRTGSILVGDVHPGDVSAVASAYTPAPGGVGPLTIAMLMENTVAAAESRMGS